MKECLDADIMLLTKIIGKGILASRRGRLGILNLHALGEE